MTTTRHRDPSTTFPVASNFLPSGRGSAQLGGRCHVGNFAPRRSVHRLGCVARLSIAPQNGTSGISGSGGHSNAPGGLVPSPQHLFLLPFVSHGGLARRHPFIKVLSILGHGGVKHDVLALLPGRPGAALRSVEDHGSVQLVWVIFVAQVRVPGDDLVEGEGGEFDVVAGRLVTSPPVVLGLPAQPAGEVEVEDDQVVRDPIYEEIIWSYIAVCDPQREVEVVNGRSELPEVLKLEGPRDIVFDGPAYYEGRRKADYFVLALDLIDNETVEWDDARNIRRRQFASSHMTPTLPSLT